MRRGPRNLRIMFDAEALTHYGGAVLLYQFLQRIGLRTLLYRSVRFPQRNNRYRISETLLALLYPIILGMGRLEVTEPLKRNGVFQYLTGLPGYPDPTSLRRFLPRFAQAGRSGFLKLHDRYRTAMLSSLRRQVSWTWTRPCSRSTVGSSRRQSDTILASVGAPPILPSCASRGRLAIAWRGHCIRATRMCSRSPSL